MLIKESCVFFSFKENTLTNKPKTICKLKRLDFFARNELNNSKTVSEIPNYKQYFYICENSGELKLTELTNDSWYLTDKRGSEINSVLIKFEDRGKLIYLKNYLKALSSPKTYIYYLIQFYTQLLKTLDLLVEKQIVHNYLKFGSMMVDPASNLLLCDFTYSLNIRSMGSNVEYIKSFFVEYDPGYLEWPLELHLLCYLLTNKLSSLSLLNIETVLNDVITKNTILRIFGDTFVSSYKAEALEYFQKYVNIPLNEMIADIFEQYKSWDNYALSILYLRILIGIHRNIKIQNKFIILFMKLLVSNIHLNPLKRHSISETTNKWHQLLDTLEPQDYNSLLQRLASA